MGSSGSHRDMQDFQGSVARAQDVQFLWDIVGLLKLLGVSRGVPGAPRISLGFLRRGGAMLFRIELTMRLNLRATLTIQRKLTMRRGCRI